MLWRAACRKLDLFRGAVLFTTRRVHKRQLLLRPSKDVNAVIIYIIAVVAARYGIEPHALCVMGNHIHFVFTDPDGHVVEFERDCHSFIARALNRMHGDFESLWSREPSYRVTCTDAEATLDKIAYTMANPVEARIVAHGKSWPGVRRAWPMKPKTVRRPQQFFRSEDEGGTWPELATLRLNRPSGLDHLSDDEVAELLRREIEIREANARYAARKASQQFAGRRRARNQSRYDFPTSKEQRSRLRPTVAGRSRWARISKLQEDRAWLARYDAQMTRVRLGESDVTFPYGTWKMRVYYAYACEGPPAPGSVGDDYTESPVALTA